MRTLVVPAVGGCGLLTVVRLALGLCVGATSLAQGCEVFAPIATNCAVDGDCDDLGYCDQGYCVARCSLDEHCPSDQVCGPAGRCQRVPHAADKDAGLSAGFWFEETDAGGGLSDAAQDEDAGAGLDTLDGDAGELDAGDLDATETLPAEDHEAANDPGTHDVDPVDQGANEIGTVEAGANDVGTVDAGADDQGVVDAGMVDTAAEDAGSVDDGTIDAANPEPQPPAAPAVTAFTAEPAALNAGGTVSLRWQATDADRCRLHSRAPGEAGWSTESVIVFGVDASYNLPVYATRQYRIECEGPGGTASGELTVEAARAYLTAPSPGLVGLEPEVVTIGYSYNGPGTCVTTPADQDVATDGVQLTVTEATPVTLTCDGYGAPLIDSLVIPQLLTSFSGPDAPVAYGDSANFRWELGVSGATCTLDGAPVTGTEASVTLYQDAVVTLACTKGATTRGASAEVMVLPGFAGAELDAALVKAEGASTASVRFRAFASPNVIGCVLVDESSAAEATMEWVEENATVHDYALEVSQAGLGVPDGARSYRVRCETASGQVATTAQSVTLWWGALRETPFRDDLQSLGALRPTLITKDLEITDDPDANAASFTTSLHALSALRQVGGHLKLMTSQALTSLAGLEQLQDIFGDLVLDGTVGLEATAAAAQDPASGLVALHSVGGQLVLQNGTLRRLRLPSLASVGGRLSVTGNSELLEIIVPLLDAVGGHIEVSRNATLLSLTHAAAIHQPLSSLVEVVDNPGLSCVVAEAFCCAAIDSALVSHSPNSAECAALTCP